MASPLSDISSAILNRRDASPKKKNTSPLKSQTREISPKSEGTTSSSPFQTEVSSIAPLQLVMAHSTETCTNQENLSPLEDRVKAEPTFEILIDADQTTDKLESDSPTSPMPITSRPRAPFSPSKFPSQPKKVAAKAIGDETLSVMREEILSLPFGVEQNRPGADENGQVQGYEDHDALSIISDDTCLSTFSAVANLDMTMIANLKIGQDSTNSGSPRRSSSNQSSQTSTQSSTETPSTSKRKLARSNSRSSSPTPRPKSSASRDGDTTNLLLDFTNPFQGLRPNSRASPTRRGLSPTKTEPNLLSHINNQRLPSPAKATSPTKRAALNLLDFDLPPQPTPRSVPSVTIRELESLKSSYLSEISSLKATLSGKEAEVESLKRTVDDAERRVGEALESLREERCAKDDAERQKAEWEKKGHEIESHLLEMREDFVNAEKEKEDLLSRLEESNHLREEAELKAATATAATAKSNNPDHHAPNGEPSAYEAIIEQRVAQQLDEKMENLARELHAVYKKKHESKVATLKKTYEARSEKKCRDLQQKIDELSKQNDELQSNADASFSDEVTRNVASNTNPEHLGQLESQRVELEEYKAKIAGLTEEIKNVQSSHDQLLQDLERERVEKGELVGAVDEMLALQAEIAAPAAAEESWGTTSQPQLKPRSLGPGGMSGSGLARPVSAIPSKSRMMMGIERMGKH